MTGATSVVRRFVSVQVPFADLRSAAPKNSRLGRPTWPDAAPGDDFVRGVGVVTSRRLGGSPVWLGEDVYCRFNRALRPRAAGGVRDVYVRLFGSRWGYRMDLGHVLPTNADLESRRGEQDFVEALFKREYALGGETKPLADLLRPLGLYIEARTAPQAAGQPQGLVRTGNPLILVEESRLGLDAPSVSLRQVRFANRTIDVVITGRPAQHVTPEQIRAARLFRLAWWRAHSEVDALRIFLRAWNQGDLAASQQLRDVLDEIGTGLSRWRSNGQDQSMIMAWQAQNHQTEWASLAADAALLTEESKGLARKIENIIERARSEELVNKVLANLPPGAAINLDVFSTKIQGSQGFLVGSGTVNANFPEAGIAGHVNQMQHTEGDSDMDPISLVVAAVVAGVTSGAGDVAKEAISDAYTGLKGLLKKLFSERGDTESEKALDATEADPQANQHQLKQRLKAYKPDDDLIDAARSVLAKHDPTGYAAGKYDVVVTNSQGVLIGDHGEQHNTFNPPQTPRE